MNLIKELIRKYDLGIEVKKGNFGIEKESLRVKENGELALTPHPEVFKDKLNHPFVTVDFSESQLEMITPPEKSVEEAYNFLKNIHEIVTLNLG
ncbi:MAG: hypothetical protein ACRC4S_03425 [Cetobacterium sp.]